MTDFERIGEALLMVGVAEHRECLSGHPEPKGIGAELIMRSLAPESATDVIPASAG